MQKEEIKKASQEQVDQIKKEMITRKDSIGAITSEISKLVE